MTVEATFVKRSYQHHSNIEYLLFCNIKVGGEFMTDHKWIKASLRLNSVKLHRGMKIKFSARMKTYLDSKDVTKNKIGFNRIRNVKVV